MTDIAVRGGWGLEEIRPTSPAPTRQDLATWVAQAREVATVADMLCRTAFVPKAFVGKPAECAAAILAGQEMGLGPMAALRAIDVIEGKPGLTALGLRALVQSHGHEIWTHESTATRAIVKGRRKGSDKVETSTWTMDRAKHLAGKDNWRKQPTAMLLARATAECARLIAADALLGMPYSSEELADGADVPVEQPTEAAPKRRTARRAPAPEPVAPPEPEFDEPAPEPQPEPAADQAEMISQPQMRKMHALFNQRGTTDRDERLAFVSLTIGRDVESSKDLTLDEARRVIDALEPAPEPPPSADEPEFDDCPPVTSAGSDE